MGQIEYGWFLSTLYNLWIFFRYVFIVLVVAFSVGGLNDFLLISITGRTSLPLAVQAEIDQTPDSGPVAGG